MESIDRLREEFDRCKGKCGSSGGHYRDIELAISAIEAEIAEKYMELPLDAEGVRVRIGDEMERISGFKYGKVAGVGDGVFFTNHYMNDYHKQFVGDCRHCKRPLEDVLEDFLDAYDSWDEFSHGDKRLDDRKAMFAKYAAEIRDLLGVE